MNRLATSHARAATDEPRVAVARRDQSLESRVAELECELPLPELSPSCALHDLPAAAVEALFRRMCEIDELSQGTAPAPLKLRLDLLRARTALEMGDLTTAAAALQGPCTRLFLLDGQRYLTDAAVVAARVAHATGDQQGCEDWLRWGLDYFAGRCEGHWFRIVDCLLMLKLPGPARFPHELQPWGGWSIRCRDLRWRCACLLQNVFPAAHRCCTILACMSYRLATRRWPAHCNLGDGPQLPNPPTAADPGRVPGTGPMPPVTTSATRDAILITRAQGGWGDLLMMTPGLRALAQIHPGSRVHFSIHKRYFPLFEGNTDFELLDIESPAIDVFDYERWINLSDCPAVRLERMTVPAVAVNRIDIFARALGITGPALDGMDRRPKYCVTSEERCFQQQFWKAHRLNGRTVVGVQLKSQEGYKDFPFMRELVRRLAEQYAVVVFHDKPESGWELPDVTIVFGQPIRQAAALAAGCDALVAPDSLFVHLAGALNLPCVALFGPTDGTLFTRYYPTVRAINRRSQFPCLPCWRNSQIPCAVSGSDDSVCLRRLPIVMVIDAVRELLAEGWPRQVPLDDHLQSSRTLDVAGGWGRSL